MDLKALLDYDNWIGQTPWDVYMAVKSLGGWQHVFPGALPIWASRIRQYFNLNPMSLTLLDDDESSDYLKEAQPAVRQAHAKAMGKLLNWEIPASDEIATVMALSGDVYEDRLDRSRRGRRRRPSIWFQTSPGAAIYHFPKLPSSPTVEAIGANELGQAQIPVFKLVCPDRTGGSRECVITGNGRATIGAVHEEVKLDAKRFVKDSVRQGSYNYAEVIEKGKAAHDRLDVHTDPMAQGYFVEPPHLFEYSELISRRFPDKDPEGHLLAKQTEPARTTWTPLALQMSQLERVPREQWCGALQAP